MYKEIYLAGGCFWGTQHLLQSLDGVLETYVGYANGTCKEDASYKTVCSGKTGFQETVKVVYDPSKICLENILLAYFYVINPEQKNQQGNDIGSQYQTGIYTVDNESKAIVNKIYAIEAKDRNCFYVDKGELKNFFTAEEYHQHYLDKNENGYCHISFNDIKIVSKIKISSDEYTKPSKVLVKEKLL